MEKIPMTKKGFLALESELKNLKEVERPTVIEAISIAREHGDLSENAEYHAAREKQSFIEGRIKELESVTGLAQIIDPTTMSGETIKFGATVVVADDDDEESEYQIVGKYEADITRNLISIASPLGRALIGKDVGDCVEVAAPGGSKEYEIVEVEFK
ncbi:MAG: transcription elongation factor GreA [Alphaproteobacteria bacterium]|nr:transcription elongation factor GreA [Alphaproteobacteria bacterium]